MTHVMPTRLAELEKEVNAPFNEPNERQHPFYPRDLRGGVRRKIDLNLRLAEELLSASGGERVKSENQSPRRCALLCELAGCVFHGSRIEPGPSGARSTGPPKPIWMALMGQENGGVLYPVPAGGTARRSRPASDRP